MLRHELAGALERRRHVVVKVRGELAVANFAVRHVVPRIVFDSKVLVAVREVRKVVELYVFLGVVFDDVSAVQHGHFDVVYELVLAWILGVVRSVFNLNVLISSNIFMILMLK